MRNLAFWLIPAAVFLAIIFIYNQCSRKQEVNILRSENELLQLTIAEYATRPPKKDTVYQYIYDTIIISKTFRAVDSVKYTDTVYIKDIYDKTYEDSIHSKDLTLFYKIKTRGDLLAYDFNYRLKKPVITIEKTLPIYTPLSEKKPAGHLYFGLGWVFSEPSASLKFDWIHRSEKWGLFYVNIPVNNIHSAGVTFKIK